MSRAKDFEMIVTAERETTKVRLRGFISEIVDLNAEKVPPARPVILDVGEVQSLNSLGVRNWVRFLDAMCAKAPYVLLQRLSPMLVFQASMISTFLSKARVESFVSPWCCLECDHVLELTHSLQEEIPDTVACPKCKSAMEFDSDIDSYQAFRQLAMQQR